MMGLANAFAGCLVLLVCRRVRPLPAASLTALAALPACQRQLARSLTRAAPRHAGQLCL